MKLIVCVDKNNGLSFNHRRQSRDRIVTQDIVRCAPVRIAPASVSLFADYPGAVMVSEDFLTAAKPDEWCFAELLPLPEAPEALTLYRWDRDYPADAFLPYDLSRWTLVSVEELTGYSHERIFKEVYAK